MTCTPMIRPVLAASLIALLTACGGGGGAGSETPATTDPTIPAPEAGPSTLDPADVPRTTTALDEAANGMIDTWAGTTPIAYTSLAVIPTSGSARYDGYLYGALSDARGSQTESVIGRLNLDVAFSNSSAGFTGNASDFVTGDNDALTGTLSISGGGLNRNGNPASDATVQGVAVNGTLTGAGATRVFGIALEGDFLGTTAEAIGGDALGRVTVDGTDQDFDGGFIAEN